MVADSSVLTCACSSLHSGGKGKTVSGTILTAVQQIKIKHFVFHGGFHIWLSTQNPNKAENTKALLRFCATNNVLTQRTNVLLETLYIFPPILLETHLLFEYPGVWLLWLFLEMCPHVKQAVDLTARLTHRELG